MNVVPLVVSILCIVMVSGCTVCIPPFCDSVDSYESDVVIIKDLTAIPSKIAPGQQTRITAYVQNVGNTPTENFGSVDVVLYDYCKGLFEVEEGDMDCPGTKSEDNGLIVCHINSLLPQEIRQVSWVLSPHGDIKLPTTCPNDGMKVYVRYNYETNGITTISFIHPDELARQLQDNTYTTKTSDTTVGYGPLKPVITVEDQQPIPAYKDTPTSTTISLQILNSGSGYPVPLSPDKSDSVHVNNKMISINLPDSIDVIADNCRFVKNGEFYQPNDNVSIRIIDGESAKIFCEISSLSVSDVPKETTRTIDVNMKYYYEFRDSVKVEVVPSGY